jgi:hypothetical protein
MGTVTIRFVGGTSAPAKKNGAFLFDDPALGIGDPEMPRDFQRPPLVQLEPGVSFFHDSSVSSVNPAFLCIPSQ